MCSNILKVLTFLSLVLECGILPRSQQQENCVERASTPGKRADDVVNIGAETDRRTTQAVNATPLSDRHMREGS